MVMCQDNGAYNFQSVCDAETTVDGSAETTNVSIEGKEIWARKDIIEKQLPHNVHSERTVDFGWNINTEWGVLIQVAVKSKKWKKTKLAIESEENISLITKVDLPGNFVKVSEEREIQIDTDQSKIHCVEKSRFGISQENQTLPLESPVNRNEELERLCEGDAAKSSNGRFSKPGTQKPVKNDKKRSKSCLIKPRLLKKYLDSKL